MKFTDSSRCGIHTIKYKKSDKFFDIFFIILFQKNYRLLMSEINI